MALPRCCPASLDPLGVSTPTTYGVYLHARLIRPATSPTSLPRTGNSGPVGLRLSYTRPAWWGLQPSQVSSWQKKSFVGQTGFLLRALPVKILLRAINPSLDPAEKSEQDATSNVFLLHEYQAVSRELNKINGCVFFSYLGRHQVWSFHLWNLLS